jgi:hypothetical protein
MEFAKVSTRDSAETKRGKKVYLRVLRIREGLPISIDMPRDFCTIRTLSVSESNIGRNRSAITRLNAYLYGILSFVSE